MKAEDNPKINSLLRYLTSKLNIESVLCYGSYGAGLQDKNSDVDILILLDKLPSPAQLHELYKGIPHVKNIEEKDLRHWDNVWTLHNTALEVDDLKIEVGYNTLAWVKKIIKKLIQDNQISFKEFSFRPYTFLGLLEHSACIYDRHDFIKNVKSNIRPFPLGLKKEIVKSFLPILNDCYEDLVDNLQRDIGILAYQFQVFVGMDALIQLLWVINDVYDPASKRTEFYLYKLKCLPNDFKEFIQVALANSYVNKKDFIDAFEKVKKFLEERLSELKFIE